MVFESRRIFELIIFKDVNQTNWTKPSVHTFPISADAFPRFNRADPYPENSSRIYRRGNRAAPAHPYTSRDGLLNLWKCDPEQLSFLQKHIDDKNAEVKKKHKKIREELQRLKEEDKQKDEEERERQKTEMERQLDSFCTCRSRNRSRSLSRDRPSRSESVSSNHDDGKRKRSRERQCRCAPWKPLPPPPPPALPGVYPTGNAYPAPFPPPPPPPLQYLGNRFPPSIRGRPPRLDRTKYETPWTLESVELDLQPYETVFQKDESYYHPYDSDSKDKEKKGKAWKAGSLKVSSYKLSEAGKYELAVVVSRNICIERKRSRQVTPVYRGRRGSDASYYGPISPEGSVYGETFEDSDQAYGDEVDEGNNHDDDDYDHDMEVIPIPNETEPAVPRV